MILSSFSVLLHGMSGGQIARCIPGFAAWRYSAAHEEQYRPLQPVQEFQRLFRRQFVRVDLQSTPPVPGLSFICFFVGSRFGRPPKTAAGHRSTGRPCRLFRRLPIDAAPPLPAQRRHRGKPGQPCHLHAVGTVGRTLGDFMQENHIAFPFLDAHGDIGKARQACQKAPSTRENAWQTGPGSG